MKDKTHETSDRKQWQKPEVKNLRTMLTAGAKVTFHVETVSGTPLGPS